MKKMYKRENWCSSYMHRWTTTVVMGIPVMICKKCGATLPQSVMEKTITKREIRRMQKKKPIPSTYEIAKKIWEDKYGNTR